jgi:hypothetical protein
MGRINRAWHSAHPMPKNPSEKQRIAWHLDHVRNCGCRDIPRGVLALMRERGIAVPEPHETLGPTDGSSGG